MRKCDPVSPEIRLVEKEVDACYRSNPLLQLPFSEAAWYFLAHCEEHTVKDHITGANSGIHDRAGSIDELIHTSKWPMRWIRENCLPGNRIPNRYSPEWYCAARQLFELSEDYGWFESAFTYASLGLANLSLVGTRLVAARNPFDARYEAYDRLTKPVDHVVSAEAKAFLCQIDQSVRISNDKFRYLRTPQFIQRGMIALDDLWPRSVLLPDDWSFPRYTIGEVDRVGRALQTLAFVHFRARLRAADLGCVRLGYSSALLVMSNEEIEARVIRYTGLPRTVVAAVLEDLTYGSRDQRHGDPAIQPLIPLTRDKIAIPPTIMISSDFRRNFAVLLQRMPQEQSVYSALNEQREALSRDKMNRLAERSGFRTWAGRWPRRPDLPDIDVVIISDQEKHCLFVELKAFIEPADAREVIQRDEDIAKGVAQSRRLRQAFLENSSDILDLLRVNKEYTSTFGVASEFGIGSGVVQDPAIPVIRVDHLLARFSTLPLLKDVCTWLVDRAYLPIEGVHFEQMTVVARVGNWELEWYGIRPLLTGEFH